MPETKKKLFIIINRLAHAGGSVDALSMAYCLAVRYNVTVIYGEKEKGEEDIPLPLDDSKIRFIKIASLHRSVSPLNDLASLRKLRQLLQKYKPDIIHTHGFKPGLLGRMAAKQKHVPVIVHTYHGHVFHSYYSARISRFICFIERKLASVSDRIIALSPHQAYELSTVYRIAPVNKISTVFIGIDEQNFITNDDSKYSLRAEYNIPHDAVIVAVIGRLVPIKNHSFFVSVAEKMIRNNNNVFFFIIGDGEQKTAIKKEIIQRGLQYQEGAGKNKDTRIYFTSWITDIVSALSETDIVVSTSLNEGTPVSLIEAQWLAKPVVATNVGGVRDTIINNETGFLVDDFNLAEFVKKLQLLINDNNLRNSMGKKGERFVKDRFSKQKETDAIDKLYTDCLQNKKS